MFVCDYHGYWRIKGWVRDLSGGKLEGVNRLVRDSIDVKRYNCVCAH